jgi:hypothetical protein
MSPLEIFIPITAILVGGIIVGVPVVGLTARFAFKPVVEAFLRMKGAQADDRVPRLESRLALMEEQLHALERAQERLVEEAEFHRQLSGKA